MLVALPSSSTTICLGKILVASVIWRVGYIGDEVLLFGDFEGPFRTLWIYLCNLQECGETNAVR